MSERSINNLLVIVESSKAIWWRDNDKKTIEYERDEFGPLLQHMCLVGEKGWEVAHIAKGVAVGENAKWIGDNGPFVACFSSIDAIREACNELGVNVEFYNIDSVFGAVSDARASDFIPNNVVKTSIVVQEVQ